MEADIFFSQQEASLWRSSEYTSELSLRLTYPVKFSRNVCTEENTCMTSSEDNRVSIPPKRSGIGLSDDRSCVSSHKLAFSFCGLCRVSTGNRHRYMRPICTHCQILFNNTGSLCFLQHNHVKSWNLIIWSYLAVPLSGGLQEFKD